MSNENISVSDLRRALLFYLAGLCSYLAFLSLAVGAFVAGFSPGQLDLPPQWIMIGFFVTSASLIVVSQLWYIRTKHVMDKHENFRIFSRTYAVELLTALWIVFLWVVFVTIFAEPSPIRLETQPESIRLFISGFILPFFRISAWILLIGVPVYLPVILYWNIRRLVDRKLPDRDRYAKIAISSVLGLVSSAVIMFLLTFAALVLLNSVGTDMPRS